MLVLVRVDGQWEDQGHSVQSRRKAEPLIKHLKEAYGRDNVRIVTNKQWKEIQLKRQQDEAAASVKREEILKQQEEEQRRMEEAELHPKKERLREKRVKFFSKLKLGKRKRS